MASSQLTLSGPLGSQPLPASPPSPAPPAPEIPAAPAVGGKDLIVEQAGGKARGAKRANPEISLPAFPPACSLALESSFDFPRRQAKARLRFDGFAGQEVFDHRHDLVLERF